MPASVAEAPACIWVLAGTNGAGKSSVGGEFLRRAGGDYFNPDEAARRLLTAHPRLTQAEANSRAWHDGVRLLVDAIEKRHSYFFETTLGGETIVGLLESALDARLEVRVWYAGLASPELHIARVAARVAKGGHAIPDEDIRRRYDNSRLNLIRLLPRLSELQIHDNSAEADPAQGDAPKPRLLLHWLDGAIVAPDDFTGTPRWAKPIVAAALKARPQRG